MNELISKFQNLIAGILIVLILCYGTYTYIYKPKYKEINTLKSSLKLMDSEIKMIQGGEMLLRDIEGARSLLRKELDELSKKIPFELQTPYVINNFISVVGKGLNIDYNLIQPGDIVQEQQYKRLPLRVEFEGNYKNLNSYLDQLKKLPVTIRVDTMDLRRLSGTKKLSVKLSMSAFVMPGGTEGKQSGIKPESYMFDPFYRERITSGGIKTEGVKGVKYLGYWMSGSRLNAIVNDEILSAGQSVNGYNILKIYKDMLILKKDNKLYELPLERVK